MKLAFMSQDAVEAERLIQDIDFDYWNRSLDFWRGL